MNKYQKIRILKDLDLNTEDSVLISDVKDKCPYKGKISIRTQWRDEQRQDKTPHVPICDSSEFGMYKKEFLAAGLELIVSEGIDPKDAALAGCIMRNENNYVVEIAMGPGTVRRVTHRHLIDARYMASLDHPITHNDLVNSALRKVHDAYRDGVLAEKFIFEFSYYNKPVGYKKQNVIFWEYYAI